MHVFIDTAVKGCTVALFNDTEIFACAQEPIERGHAETLLPLCQNLMQSINKTAKDIESVYVTIGPGSFTGLRVGLSVACFMGYSLGISVHGISTFQAFSASIESNRPRMIVIETKRSDYYCQILDANHQPITDAKSLMPDDVLALMHNQTDGHILIGDAVQRFQKETEQSDYEAIQITMINAEKVVNALQNKQLKLYEAQGLYIRDADISQPKK